jgi:hypothetical protein
MNSGHTGGDRTERAAELARGIRLGVPRLHMPRAAAQPEQDDAFGQVVGANRRRRPELQEIGQRESTGAKDARLEKAPPGDSVAMPSAVSEDPQHHSYPSVWRWIAALRIRTDRNLTEFFGICPYGGTASVPL